MRPEKPHQRLEAWKLAVAFAVEAYTLSRRFPADERFGLVSQLRRAATSVPLNIAEGAARGTAAEFVRFLYIARGSASEVDTLLLLAERLGYLSADETTAAGQQLDRLLALINGLIQKLRSGQREE